MNSKGHIGFALVATSLLAVPLSCTYPTKHMIILALVSSLAAPLPDIDLSIRFLKHRGLTHTILFSLLTPLAFTAPLCFASISLCVPVYLMFSVSLFSHIVGDAMTFMGVRPFRPFSDRRVSLRIFRSNSSSVNEAMLASGVASLLLVAYLSTLIPLCILSIYATLLLVAVLLAPLLLGYRRRIR